MLTDVTSVEQVRRMLREYRIRPKRRRGQFFLVKKAIRDRIIESAELDADDVVVEVGAGLGALTEKLVKVAREIIAVELDERLVAVLKERLEDCANLKIVQGDILKFNLGEMVNRTAKLKVVSNIPYYISSPLILYFLESKLNISSISLLVEKEFAKRVVAEPGSKNYGALSIAIQYRSAPRELFSVGRGSFYPTPRVDSSFLRFDALSKPRVPLRDEKLFFAIVRAAFNQRRKTLLNALVGAKALKFDKERLETVLAYTGIDSKRRGETLSIGEFATLSNAFSKSREI